MIYDLLDDLRMAVDHMPEKHERRHLVFYLERAVRRDTSFIAQHPHLLLQALWHTC